MQLHQLGNTIQDLRHEGHNLSSVHFSINDVPYVLKSVEVTPGQVTFRLQTEANNTVREGFLGDGEKSTNREEKLDLYA